MIENKVILIFVIWCIVFFLQFSFKNLAGVTIPGLLPFRHPRKRAVVYNSEIGAMRNV
jgi:hypothetical protein